MKYKYVLGDYKVCIDDFMGLINTSIQFFDDLDANERYDVYCKIINISELKELPLSLLKMKNKLIEGVLNKKFYSVLVNRKIAIVTDVENEKLTIYADYESICDFSIYSMYVCLKKHIAALLCKNNEYLVFHGAVAYDPKHENAWLIVGESGGGKSTISWTLINNGFELLSDDLAVIRRENNKVSGHGGTLYVTEDFVKRFHVKKYDVVSPGRKMRIQVNKCSKKDVPITKIIIASGVAQRQCIKLDSSDILPKLCNSQVGWDFYQKNQKNCEEALKDISSQVEVYEAYINDNIMNFINMVAEEN